MALEDYLKKCLNYAGEGMRVWLRGGVLVLCAWFFCM